MANRETLTLFTWGYSGWGNSTRELVDVVDLVEGSRGFGAPFFVDVRARRKVRAAGFREQAFQKLLGPGRHEHIEGLGNLAILDSSEQNRLIDPEKAVALFARAAALHEEHRRVIYFCSCPSPGGECHRHLIAPELFKEARRRGRPVTVVEWPGTGDGSGGAHVPRVEVDRKVWGAIANESRTSIPLPDHLPAPELGGLEWYAPVEVTSTEGRLYALAGPAQHRAGGWQLPVRGLIERLDQAREQAARGRKEVMAEPRSWMPLGSS